MNSNIISKKSDIFEMKVYNILKESIGENPWNPYNNSSYFNIKITIDKPGDKVSLSGPFSYYQDGDKAVFESSGCPNYRTPFGRFPTAEYYQHFLDKVATLEVTGCSDLIHVDVNIHFSPSDWTHDYFDTHPNNIHHEFNFNTCDSI